MRGLVLIIAVAAAGVAAADPIAEAKEHSRKATQLYDLGRFAEAAKEYELAFRLSDKPGFLFNIAQAHRLGGDNQAALSAYRGYLRRAPDAANRAEVEELVAGLEQALKPPAVHPAEVPIAAPPVAAPPVAAPPVAAPPIAAPSVAAPPAAPAPPERATFLRLVGEDASADKQRRCEEVFIERGWRLRADARAQVQLRLTSDANDLAIFVDGRSVERRLLGREGMRELCAQAISVLETTNLRAGWRFEPPPSSAHLGPPPTEKDLAVALGKQRWGLSACRADFAKQVDKVDLNIQIGPNGDIGAVELAGIDDRSRFATCIQRVIRQLRFAPFRGGLATLHNNFAFGPVVLDAN